MNRKTVSTSNTETNSAGGLRKAAGNIQLWMLVLLILFALLYFFVQDEAEDEAGKSGAASEMKLPVRTHLDHSAYFQKPFETPQEVTQACLKCHPQAASEVMKTAHWQWLGDEVVVPGHEKPQKIGKKNLINNFCISIVGNWPSCTQCHAGYGWADDSFDFNNPGNIDCLVCHERNGTYVKGAAGIPPDGTDLLAAARSVGYPKRENCAVCHNYGGGGQGVKHGDLDSSLDNPTREDDVHMGQLGFLCIDCHKTDKHDISGRAYSVSVEHKNGIACKDCHSEPAHRDSRINAHLDSVACQTCHIPTYARKLPTKTYWDWSKAGDPNRTEDPHHYLKIKGEFVYDHDVVPEYRWFNLNMNRYLLGDKIDPQQVTDINLPLGDIDDKSAKIWPFKVHRARQHYDVEHRTLLTPLTGGKGGFWHDFDWNRALELGAEATGTQYSGKYDFAETAMYWPLNHMVTPKENALQCAACHSDNSRMDWNALGYSGDPLKTGGRK